jgi:hypothetical protein
MHSGKDVENRTWSTRFRGDFLVHAGVRWTRDEREDCVDLEEDIRRGPRNADGKHDMHLGMIIGVVTLVECVRSDTLRSEWAISGNWGFVLANPRSFVKPIKYKGTLGFFEVPDDLVARTEEDCDKRCLLSADQQMTDRHPR